MTDLFIHVGFDDGLVLMLDGELDLDSSTQLRAAVERVFERRSTRRLVLDLTHLTFMDSQGLHVLERCSRLARRDGAELVLRRPRRLAALLLEATGLGAYVEGDDRVRDHGHGPELAVVAPRTPDPAAR